MKRIGLVIHAGRHDATAYAVKAAAMLVRSGVQVSAEDETIAGLCGAIPFSCLSDAEVPEMIVSLGGDGTLLRGVQWAVRWNAALLGVNLGTVGFLANEEPDNLESTIERLLHADYSLEERELLRVRTDGAGEWLALNDVVVSRGGYARLITINALVDGESAGRYVADGLIVATPTGSTGYSLSAGGPVIAPSVDCMVITPICAHSLQHRPAVVPGSASIRLAMAYDEAQTASLEVDGRSCACLRGGAVIEISKAEQKVRLVRMNKTLFFQLVRDKLTEWSR